MHWCSTRGQITCIKVDTTGFSGKYWSCGGYRVTYQTWYIWCCPETVSEHNKVESSLFPGKRQSVSPAVVDTFKTQAECLRMPAPIMTDSNYGENFNYCVSNPQYHTKLFVLCLIFNVHVHRNLPGQHHAFRGHQCPQLLIRGQDGTPGRKNAGCFFWYVCELIY